MVCRTGDVERIVEIMNISEKPEFIYEGNDLGANYSKEFTLFKVWSPTAERMKLVLYNRFDSEKGEIYYMKKGEKGTWEIKLYGDFSNKYYNYRVTIDGIERETPDPYTKGASVNGSKGMIVDFDSINPDEWHKLGRNNIKRDEAIIYEIHLRDFSVYNDSGIKNKGKYLAFTEKGTKSSNGIITGIDHLKDLGITHVHLLPVYDFASVDEGTEGYNWGYDPYLFNVPEGLYSTNPYDGRIRIREFKEMVKSLHEEGINIVMDVVYNHTFCTKDSPFEILVPGYYYRKDCKGIYTKGSGCENETASEKPMMRKFIVDSVKFWAKEYKIDGFRFDLMALHDINTMKEVERELLKINPNILLYGEPWTGGNSALSYSEQMTKGKQKGMGIAVFNDEIRNAIKGDNDGCGTGFVNGALGQEENIKKGIVGEIRYSEDIKGFAQEPLEVINYVSSHDNLCLFDKFEKSNNEDSEEIRERMNRLALSIILTSQGIPFIQGGTEVMRTKGGNHNSYNAGNDVNQIDWSRKEKYYDTFKYIKGLIEIRRNQQVMHLKHEEDIRKSLQFISSPYNTIVYMLKSECESDFKNIFIIHNSNREHISLNLPDKEKWKVIANDFEANINGVKRGARELYNKICAAPLSTYILYRD